MPNFNDLTKSGTALTEEEKNALHSHTNKDILDDVEEPLTTVLKNKIDGIEPNAEVNNISDENALLLVGSDNIELHYHSSDRDRNNHTGTQSISTISNLQSELDNKLNINDFMSKHLEVESSKNGFINYNSTFFLDSNFQFEDYINETTRKIVRDNCASGSSGSLFIKGGGGTLICDDFISINADISYRAFVKTMQDSNNSSGGRFYFGVSTYDFDTQRIEYYMTNYTYSTITELTQDLNDGDTEIHVTSTTDWYNESSAYRRAIIFWELQSNGKYCYQGLNGKLYDEFGYSRKSYTKIYDEGGIDEDGVTIHLKNPWNGGTIQSGTKIANSKEGGTYIYYLSNIAVDNDDVFHTFKSSWRVGEGKPQLNNGNGESGAFRNGGSKIKILVLPNYRNSDGSSYDSTDIGYYSILGIQSKIIE